MFIAIQNEIDYNTVWTKQRMSIEGKLIRIQAWTTFFTLEEETPIVPVWILLPGLPWHSSKSPSLFLLESLGKV